MFSPGILKTRLYTDSLYMALWRDVVIKNDLYGEYFRERKAEYHKKT